MTVEGGRPVRGATWFDRDYPVLLAAAKLTQASDYNHCTTYEIAEETGLEVRDVVKALANLEQRYVNLHEAGSLAQRDYIVTGLTAAGLEAADVWPASDALAQRLVEALERALDDTPADSPKAGRLRAALNALKDLGVGASGNLLAQALAVALGLGVR